MKHLKMFEDYEGDYDQDYDDYIDDLDEYDDEQVEVIWCADGQYDIEVPLGALTYLEASGLVYLEDDTGLGSSMMYQCKEVDIPQIEEICQKYYDEE